MWLPRFLAIGAFAVAAGASVPAMQDATRSDALGLQKKFDAIAKRGLQAAPKGAASVRTSFTERELNAYFSVNGPVIFPTGVTKPELFIDDAGKFRTRCIVDLNAVRSSKQRGWLDPMAYLAGALELTAIGQLTTANGLGTLKLETATLGGVPIPVTLVQELVAFYSKTPDNPAGFDLQKPFELPSRIRTIETKKGAATIVQ